MTRTRIITVSGEICSGKSSLTSALVAIMPGWTHENTGARFREYCKSRGIPIQEVSQVPDDIHIEFDSTQRRLLEKGSRIVVEGRLAGWLASNLEGVFKVFCFAPDQVRIERYAQREGVSISEASDAISYRDGGDMTKYQRVYSIEDYRSPEFYDLIVDTSAGNPATLARQILKSAGLMLINGKLRKCH